MDRRTGKDANDKSKKSSNKKGFSQIHLEDLRRALETANDPPNPSEVLSPEAQRVKDLAVELVKEYIRHEKAHESFKEANNMLGKFLQNKAKNSLERIKKEIETLERIKQEKVKKLKSQADNHLDRQDEDLKTRYEKLSEDQKKLVRQHRIIVKQLLERKKSKEILEHIEQEEKPILALHKILENEQKREIDKLGKIKNLPENQKAIMKQKTIEKIEVIYKDIYDLLTGGEPFLSFIQLKEKKNNLQEIKKEIIEFQNGNKRTNPFERSKLIAKTKELEDFLLLIYPTQIEIANNRVLLKMAEKVKRDIIVNQYKDIIVILDDKKKEIEDEGESEKEGKKQSDSKKRKIENIIKNEEEGKKQSDSKKRKIDGGREDEEEGVSQVYSKKRKTEDEGESEEEGEKQSDSKKRKIKGKIEGKIEITSQNCLYQSKDELSELLVNLKNEQREYGTTKVDIMSEPEKLQQTLEKIMKLKIQEMEKDISSVASLVQENQRERQKYRDKLSGLEEERKNLKNTQAIEENLQECQNIIVQERDRLKTQSDAIKSNRKKLMQKSKNMGLTHVKLEIIGDFLNSIQSFVKGDDKNNDIEWYNNYNKIYKYQLKHHKEIYSKIENNELEIKKIIKKINFYIKETERDNDNNKADTK